MKQKLFFLVFAFLFVSCAPSYYVQNDYDKFENITRHSMGNAWLTGKDDGMMPNTALYPVKIEDKDGKTTFFLKLVYVGSGWIFVEDGESLKLLIDGNKKINLKSVGDSSKNREVVQGDIVSETIWYPLTKEELKEIANAGFIELKIIGSKGYLIKQFPAETQINYRKFVKDLNI